MKKDLDYWKDRYYNAIESRKKDLESWSNKLTPIETIALMSLLNCIHFFGQLNLSIKMQHKIGKYRVDFLVIYEPTENHDVSRKIIIECDGHEFHEKTKHQAIHDKERDRYFTKSGYTVLRYTGSELVNDRWILVHDIAELILNDNSSSATGYSSKSS